MNTFDREDDEESVMPASVTVREIRIRHPNAETRLCFTFVVCLFVLLLDSATSYELSLPTMWLLRLES